MTDWATEFARQILHEERFGHTWTHLQAEVSEAVDEIETVFRNSNSKRKIANTTGEQAIDIRDDRGRTIQFRLDKACSLIRVTSSWDPKSEYSFLITDAIGTIVTHGPIYPGMKSQNFITVKDLVKATTKSVVAG